MKELKKRALLLETQSNQKSGAGFTLIELLVVVAIIALLSSIGLIALQSARQKSRNVRRLGDMTQMNTALELYFATNKGYPSSTAGQPLALVPHYTSVLPNAPFPADGVCDGVVHSAAVTADNGGVPVLANNYYYIALGAGFNNGSIVVYPSYTYYFCLGDQTGNFSAGERILTPSGVQ